MKFTIPDIQKLSNIAKGAGNIISKYYHQEGLAIRVKPDGSQLTEADEESNRYISEQIRKQFPKVGLVTEEGEKEWGEYTFEVDPLDGTRQFIDKVPEFAISIGLLHKETPIFGLIYNPITEELFYGGLNYKSYFVNGNNEKEELRIEQGRAARENILVFAYTLKIERAKEIYPNIEFDKYLHMGSEGLRLTSIVTQKANLRVELRKDTFGQWDVCAGQAILEGAGGFVTALDGSKLMYQRGVPYLQTGFIAADSKDRLQEIIKSVSTP